MIKILAFIGIIVIPVAIGGFGVLVGLRINTRNTLREMGFTGHSCAIYRDAMQLLARLARPTSLDDLDILTQKTSKEINDLLDRYQKETEDN